MSASTTEVKSVEGVKVGDFFVSSWGYDQTNIDFYKVVGLTAKRIKVQAWTSRTVSNLGSQVLVVPGEGPVTFKVRDKETGLRTGETVEARVEIKTVRHFGDVPRFTVNSYSGARLWEGKPESETAPGWGR